MPTDRPTNCLLLRAIAVLAVACFALPMAGCPKPDIVPLIGEDPEIIALIGATSVDDPSSSPLASARRLHQAVIQKDTELAWTLLARETRGALDELGATIGVSGRELLDASTLPGKGGTVRRVRFDTVFFGPDVVDLLVDDEAAAAADRAVLRSIARDGRITERTMVRETDGWKLAQTTF